MSFHPTVNITEQIADHLAELVIEDKLNGGSRIQELKVAKELGVSRGSVREALLILERRHLIEIVPRRGAVVNELSVVDALELIETLAEAEQSLLHKLSDHQDAELARVIEATQGAVAAMEAAAREGNVGASLRGRLDFYGGLLSTSSRYLRAVFECLLPTSQRVFWYLLEHSPVDLHDIARFYRAVLVALGERDGERLNELLNGYRHRFAKLTQEAFGQSQKSLRQRPRENGLKRTRVGVNGAA